MTSKMSSVFGDEDKTKLFQLLFVKDDNYESVEVVETSEVDVEQLLVCLNQGESVFIKRKY